jgi:predicted RNase H-like nuclease
MQVDAFVRANRSLDIREVHPELVFQRLNGGRPLASKKSEAGMSMRRQLLQQAGLSNVNEWIAHTRLGTGAKRDDVLDACSVAIAARDPLGSVPEGIPPLDAFGLRMQIWF